MAEITLNVPAETTFGGVVGGVAALVAGESSFAYDRVMQLRAAVTEAFEHAMRALEDVDPSERQVRIRFDFTSARIQAHFVYKATAVSPEEEEIHLRLLRSLLDEVTILPDLAGGIWVHMVMLKE